ncbi:MAG: type II secretion system protein [Planctomycetia bacterium]|nr:type II secretion system protein [Planctomycetia bacterium]
MKKNGFTLVELLVVIAIIGLKFIYYIPEVNRNFPQRKEIEEKILCVIGVIRGQKKNFGKPVRQKFFREFSL